MNNSTNKNTIPTPEEELKKILEFDEKDPKNLLKKLCLTANFINELKHDFTAVDFMSMFENTKDYVIFRTGIEDIKENSTRIINEMKMLEVKSLIDYED